MIQIFLVIIINLNGGVALQPMVSDKACATAADVINDATVTRVAKAYCIRG